MAKSNHNEDKYLKKVEKLEKIVSKLQEENSKLKEYNEHLLKDNELIDALMENIPDQIYFKDKKCCFTFANKSCFDKFDLKSPVDLIGKTDLDFFLKKYAKTWMEEEHRIMKTGKPVIGKEELEIWPDGRETWTHSTKMPYYDNKGKVIGIFGVARDITKLKQTEQQLQALMDNIPDSIYFKDKESCFLRVNKSCATKHNLADPADAISKTDYDFFPKEFAREYMASEKKIIKTGKPIISEEYLEPIKGAREKWISTTKMPLRNNMGKIIGTFGVSRDITKLKLAEKSLQVSNEKLEKKVQKRTSELRLANEGMKIRIQQLNYLNRKAHFFAQLIDRETLLTAIFYAFVERFPDGEVHLCEMRNEGFVTVLSTDHL
jgi:PAS domain S-box-containing protein